MKDDLPDYCQLPDEPARHLTRVGIVLLALLVLLLVGTVSYLIGEKLQNFSWATLRSGLLAFGMFTLGSVLAAVVFTTIVRIFVLLLPDQAKGFYERRQLRKAHKAAMKAVATKEELSEERVRLTSKMQATLLFEKQSGHAANTRASREFREALQASIVRSCDIAFEHIGKVIDEYEQLIAEISNSILPTDEKTKLLKDLTKQMDVAAQKKRNREARQLMTAEIWRVRLRKARAMSRENPQAAIGYLKKLTAETQSASIRSRIAEMITELTQAQPAEPMV